MSLWGRPESLKFDISPNSLFLALYGHSIIILGLDHWWLWLTFYQLFCSQIMSLVSIKINQVKMFLQGGPKTKKCHLAQKQLIVSCKGFFDRSLVQVTSWDHLITIYICWCWDMNSTEGKLELSMSQIEVGGGIHKIWHTCSCTFLNIIDVSMPHHFRRKLDYFALTNFEV